MEKTSSIIFIFLMTFIVTLSSVSAFYASYSQISEGYSESFYTGSVLGFDINKSHYTLLVSKIQSTNATVKFSTSADRILFNVGEEKKFDLNNDSIWDVSLRLDNIEKNFADFTIKSIYEKVGGSQEVIDLTPKKQDIITASNISKNNTSSVGETKTSSASGLIIAGLVILIIFVIFFYILREKRRKDKLYGDY